MRILQVCPRYRPHIGGVETVVEEVSRRLAAKGHEVTVVATDPTRSLPRQESLDGVSVVRFRSFAPGDAYYFAPGLRAFLRKASCDVVHAHGYHALPALAATVSRAPRFVFTPHYHGKGHTPLRNLLLRPYRLAGDRIFARADAVTCVSAYEKGLVCRDFPQRCAKASVVPNGINKAEFAGLEPFPKKDKVLLYVGRLEEYKGVQYAIRALPHLSGYTLVVIGRGPYRDELRRLAAGLGLEGRVRFLEGLPP